jgi:hypothetical protein
VALPANDTGGIYAAAIAGTTRFVHDLTEETRRKMTGFGFGDSLVDPTPVPTATPTAIPTAAVEHACLSACPAGYFGHEDTLLCTACAVGQFADEAGMINGCKACFVGRYVDVTGTADATDCTACVAGKYVDVTGSDEASDCIDCGIGKYVDVAGSDEESDCIDCVVGTYIDVTGTSVLSDCIDCVAGKYVDVTGSDDATDCIGCGIGKYVDVTGSSNATACIDCDAGSITDTLADTGASTCTACAAGEYSAASTAACAACAAGYYSGNGATTCDACTVGKYVNVTGSKGVSDCIMCVAGKYINVTGANECKPCPSGRVQESPGRAVCHECGSGQYRSESTCIDCEPGRYTDGSGLTFCKACPGGYSTDSVRSSNYCAQCRPGRFAASEGTANCPTCPEIYYRQEAGSRSCFACPDLGCTSGEYNICGSPSGFASPGLCVQCSPGKFLADRKCEGCSRGQYSSSDGARCIGCPLGKFQAKEDKAYCDEVPPGSMVAMMTSTEDSEVLEPAVLFCPAVGVECSVGSISYDGAVWHGPVAVAPNCTSEKRLDCTRFYTCINDGCPDKSATEMTCKEGYHGTLCALCDNGYFKSLRECVSCASPRVPALIGLVLGSCMLVGIVLFVARKYRRYLLLASVFSYFKVLVSFVTVATTLENQFGVIWPSSFARALETMSVLSLDFTSFVGGLCFFDMSFYQSLLSSTLLLLVAVFVIGARSYVLYRRRCAALALRGIFLVTGDIDVEKIRHDCIFVSIYLLLFAYPVVSVKIVAAFAW